MMRTWELRILEQVLGGFGFNGGDEVVETYHSLHFLIQMFII